MALRLHKIQLRIAIAAYAFTAGLASPTYAQEQNKAEVKPETEQRYNDTKAIRSSSSYSASQFNMSAEYFNMKAGKATLRGMGFNLNTIHGFAPKWALGGSLNQAYSPKDNFAATYLALEVRLGYAIMGAYRKENLEHSQENWTVATIQREPTTRIEFGPHLTQFFLNTKSGALPFSGFGLDLLIDYPLFGDFHASSGASIDRLNNGNVMITRTRMLFGFGLTL